MWLPPSMAVSSSRFTYLFPQRAPYLHHQLHVLVPVPVPPACGIMGAAADTLRRCLFVLQALLLWREVSAGVTAVIVFGDSSVDAGNNNQLPTIARCDFAPYGRDFFGGQPTGRFCNGRLATDFLAEAFGLKPAVPAYLDPAFGIEDFATGVTFASAATGYDNVTASVLKVIPLWQQLEYFKDYQQRLKSYQGEEKAKATLEEALYVISLGTNDFIENYYLLPTRSSQFTVEEYEGFVAGIARDFVLEIYAMGARKIDVTGIPPMGCIPVSRTVNIFPTGGRSCREDYNQVAADFNGRLATMVVQLNAALPEARIVFADLYGFFLDLVNHPSSYGFENAEDGCCATGQFEAGFICNQKSPFTCEDANKYVFWDSVHPSEMAYRLVADYLMKTSLAQFL